MASPISDAEFDAKVTKGKGIVVMDFWAPWCGPCKAMNPVLDELSAQYGDKVSFLKMNVDENPVTPQNFNVMSIPTFIIFKDGQATDTFIGVRSKEDFSSRLDAIVGA